MSLMQSIYGYRLNPSGVADSDSITVSLIQCSGPIAQSMDTIRTRLHQCIVGTSLGSLYYAQDAIINRFSIDSGPGDSGGKTYE